MQNRIAAARLELNPDSALGIDYICKACHPNGEKRNGAPTAEASFASAKADQNFREDHEGIRWMNIRHFFRNDRSLSFETLLKSRYEDSTNRAGRRRLMESRWSHRIR